MKRQFLFKFRLWALGGGKVTMMGVILSWKDGVIEIMDQDLKRRTLPENRVIKIDRIGANKELRSKTSEAQAQYIQLDLFN